MRIKVNGAFDDYFLRLAVTPKGRRWTALQHAPKNARSFTLLRIGMTAIDVAYFTKKQEGEVPIDRYL